MKNKELEAKLNDSEKRYTEEKAAHRISNNNIILYKKRLKEMMEKEARMNASNNDNHHANGNSSGSGSGNSKVRASEADKVDQQKEE